VQSQQKRKDIHEDAVAARKAELRKREGQTFAQKVTQRRRMALRRQRVRAAAEAAPTAEAAPAVLQNGQPAVDVLMDNAEAALAVMQNGQPAVDDLMDNE
jgi:hypothetical protein